MENTFTILPMNHNFTLQPGESYTGFITIVNPISSEHNLSYSVSVSPYNITNNDYQVDITKKSFYSEIVDWITIQEPTGTILPNEIKEVYFTINVPENAHPGGQYATIIVTPNPNEKESDGVSISNVFALASILYAKVDGEITHDISIIENNIPEFSITTPITISALLKNSGNIHEKAAFAIEATNLITNEKIFPEDEKQDNHFSEIIMPETTHYITRQIENLPFIGIVKIEQTIYYGNEISTVSKNVIICPIWFLFLMTFIIISIVSIIILKIKQHHKNKKS